MWCFEVPYYYCKIIFPDSIVIESQWGSTLFILTFNFFNKFEIIGV